MFAPEGYTLIEELEALCRDAASEKWPMDFSNGNIVVPIEDWKTDTIFQNGLLTDHLVHQWLFNNTHRLRLFSPSGGIVKISENILRVRDWTLRYEEDWSLEQALEYSEAWTNNSYFVYFDKGDWIVSFGPQTSGLIRNIMRLINNGYHKKDELEAFVGWSLCISGDLKSESPSKISALSSKNIRKLSKQVRKGRKPSGAKSEYFSRYKHSKPDDVSYEAIAAEITEAGFPISARMIQYYEYERNEVET